MSCTVFDDNCEGCLPAIQNIKTGKLIEKGEPAYEAIMAVWRESALMERVAFHSVCVLNSRDPLDLSLAQPFVHRLVSAAQRALERPS